MKRMRPPLGPPASRRLPARGQPSGFFKRFSRGFNAGFARLSERYGMFTARAIRTLAIIGVAYVVLIVLAVWRLSATPTGSSPRRTRAI